MRHLPPLGLYRHYKGNNYSLLGFARHSETGETMALYIPLYGDGGYWVRPLAMFLEQVEVEGKPVPRFRYIGETDMLHVELKREIPEAMKPRVSPSTKVG